MINKYNLLLLFLVFLFIYLCSLLYQRNFFGEGIYCTANTISHLNNDKAAISYSVRMYRGKGLIYAVGKLYRFSESPLTISREVKFDYTRIGKGYRLTSTSARRSKLDNVNDELISKYMSYFYTEPGDERIFDIYRVNTTGWVFNMNSTPYFLCINDI